MSTTTYTEDSPYSIGYRLRKAFRQTLDYLFLIVLGIFFLFPTIFMLVSSFKQNENQVLE